MGVVVTMEGLTLYYAGDTDLIEPMQKLRQRHIDVAFLPIGGTYTMDLNEAVEAAITISPEVVIPVHYNHVKGTEVDPMTFQREVESKSTTRVWIL